MLIYDLAYGIYMCVCVCVYLHTSLSEKGKRMEPHAKGLKDGCVLGETLSH